MNQQRGSTFGGLIIGLVVGLAIALIVAVYVTKMPLSFTNKVHTRTVDQDATEAERNKDWDPNAPLYGKKGLKSVDKVDDIPSEVIPTPKAFEHKSDVGAKVDPKSADPVGDLAKLKATESKPQAKPIEPKPVEPKPVEAKAPDTVAADPVLYFVQTGAYSRRDEAETQRARIALVGIEAKISERDQGGRSIYRVRIGPLDKAEAEHIRARLETANFDSALVRVQR